MEQELPKMVPKHFFCEKIIGKLGRAGLYIFDLVAKKNGYLLNTFHRKNNDAVLGGI